MLINSFLHILDIFFKPGSDIIDFFADIIDFITGSVYCGQNSGNIGVHNNSFIKNNFVKGHIIIDIFSLEIKERLGLQEGMANQYGNLGVIYQTRGGAGRDDATKRVRSEKRGREWW